jgi:hypothetical protein
MFFKIQFMVLYDLLVYSCNNNIKHEFHGFYQLFFQIGRCARVCARTRFHFVPVPLRARV